MLAVEGKQNPSTTDDMSLKKYVFLSLCLRIILSVTKPIYLSVIVS